MFSILIYNCFSFIEIKNIYVWSKYIVVVIKKPEQKSTLGYHDAQMW